MFRLRFRDAMLAAPLFVFAFANAPYASAAVVYAQGFETDTFDWTGASRVPSGTGGVTSASGSFHGQTGGGYTYFGGPNASTGGSPGAFVPYTTSIAIYLDVGAGATNDTRFDWTTAISQPDGSFLRDFVFNAGFYNSSDATGPGAGTDRFIVSASNNAGRANAFPKNPGRDPIAIEDTGWYTFQEHFYEDGGLLAVELSILDSLGVTVGSWLLGGDPIATAGGSRYGWFAQNEFGALNIDDVSLVTDGPGEVPLPASLPMFASGLGALGFLRWRRKRKAVAAA